MTNPRIDAIPTTAEVGRTVEWSGIGVDETGRDARTGELLIAIDPRYFRPAEVDLLVGDATKAREKLGWVATTTLEELVSEMVAAELVTMNGAAAAGKRITVE